MLLTLALTWLLTDRRRLTASLLALRPVLTLALAWLADRRRLATSLLALTVALWVLLALALTWLADRRRLAASLLALTLAVVTEDCADRAHNSSALALTTLVLAALDWAGLRSTAVLHATILAWLLASLATLTYWAGFGTALLSLLASVALRTVLTDWAGLGATWVATLLTTLALAALLGNRNDSAARALTWELAASSLVRKLALTTVLADRGSDGAAAVLVLSWEGNALSARLVGCDSVSICPHVDGLSKTNMVGSVPGPGLPAVRREKRFHRRAACPATGLGLGRLHAGLISKSSEKWR